MSQGNHGCPGRRFGSGRPHRGLTLLELLAGTASVAVLVGFLLPAVMQAREQSKLSGCLDNLRGIAQASLTYAAEDQDENAIPAHFFMWCAGHSGSSGWQALSMARHAWGGKSGIGPTVGAERGCLGTRGYCGPATRPLNRTIYKTKFPDHYLTPHKWAADTYLELDIFKCPSDEGYPGGVFLPEMLGDWYAGGSAEQVTAYDYFGNSYCAQQCWVRYIGCSPHGYLMSNSVFLRPVSLVPDPARTILYQELAAKDAHKFERPEDPCDPCEVADRNCIRHEQAQNMAKGWHQKPWHFSHAFTDGHVEFLRMRGCVCEDVVGFSGHGCCGQASGENGRDRRIIIRGPRWQIDCLPDPPVVTPIHSPDCKKRQDDGQEPATGLTPVGF